MIQRIKYYLSEYNKSLFRVNQKELSRTSKMLLAIFLFTIFIVIGWGLEWQLKQEKSPAKAYGTACKALMNKKEDFNVRDFSRFAYRQEISMQGDDGEDAFGEDAVCKKLGVLYRAVSNDTAFSADQKTLSEVQKKLQDTQYKIQSLKDSYGDLLLEKVAKQEKAKSIFSTDVAKIKEELEKLQNSEQKYEASVLKLSDLNRYPAYTAFIDYYKAHKEELKEAYENKVRYFSFKRTMQAFAFLIPVWLLFYLAYKFMLRREYYILSHLTLHVANVAAVYGLFYLVLFIYDIIPELFFQKIIAFFMQHNMVIVLNVLAILFFVVLFGVIIYRIQKNDTTGAKKRKQELLNLKMGKCSECGCVIDGEYCFVCGFHHTTPCAACRQPTLRKGEFCRHCGAKMQSGDAA
ncbi:MAG TPA: hypothetical protein CFH81_01505 [Sulfurovum sp. UBA12169]|nr:MAG TPA: hypothetical protein CFH81_01505 [Sulfurovum sp. UBA12169]